MNWKAPAADLIAALSHTLSPEQGRAFWSEARVIVAAGGEGGGKTYLGALLATVKTTATQIAGGKSDSWLYGWIVGADFEDARRCAEEVRSLAEALGIYDKSRSSFPNTHDSQCIVALTSQVSMKTISTYDPTKLGREEPDFIIIEELSRLDKESWDRCYGRLARKYPTAWCFASGSFDSETKGSYFFEELWRTGQGPNERDITSYSLPSWGNPVRYKGGRQDKAILQLESAMSPERFMERHGGLPAPPRNAVLPEFRNSLHVSSAARFDPTLPVHLSIDPCTLVYAVLFLQQHGDELWVINEVYAHQLSHDQVLQAVMMKPEWKGIGGGEHVIDVASTQNHMGLGSAHQAWYASTGLRLRTTYVHVTDTVNRLRTILGVNPISTRPYLQIHPRCAGLIAELGGGRSPVEGINIWKMQGGKPEAKNDHAVKALGYWLTATLGSTRPNTLPLDDDGNPEVQSYLTRTAHVRH